MVAGCARALEKVALVLTADEETTGESMRWLLAGEHPFYLAALAAQPRGVQRLAQLSSELTEWQKRLRRVLDTDDLLALPRPLHLTFAAIRDRYESLPPEHLFEVAREYGARYVVVADGANSRFGRALGTSRDRSYPMGLAIRGYYESPRHDEPWIESHLDIRDKAGNVLPGYGWIFPVGDGRVNVGIGLLSTFSQWKEVNTTKLMESFVSSPQCAAWGIRPETSCGAPTGGRLPMGLAVGPWTGPTWIGTGDAIGAINPFNGEGIAYAYETGRMAATHLGNALTSGDALALRGYDKEIQATYALYFKVARAFVKIIGRPKLMRAMVGTGMHSRTLMEWVLRIMANLLRPDELGPAEAAYRAVAALARVVPER